MKADCIIIVFLEKKRNSSARTAMRRKHARLINNDDVGRGYFPPEMRRCAFDGVMGPNIPSPSPKRRKKGVYYSVFCRAWKITYE